MPDFQLTLPSLPALASSAATVWPVWSGSTTKPVQFSPLRKKQCGRLFQKARAYDRFTHRPGSGKHGGALGRIALDVLQVLMFDFLNFGTGRLDPSHAAIARKAGCCVTAVKNALRKLKALGFLTWIRRARPAEEEGRGFLLRQETNAYAILSPASWRGWQEPPPPEPWQWGACPPLPSAPARAAAELKDGNPQAALATLEEDPGDFLAAALARLGRQVHGLKS
jgi:hypothetical protein